MIDVDKVRGALLGTAVGDALGMPVEGLSHQNVRMYYKGIKAYRADEKRGGLEAGQWTGDTQLTFALAEALAARGDDARSHLTKACVALLSEARRWDDATRAAVKRLAQGAEPEVEAVPANGTAAQAAPLGAWWAATGASREAAFDFMIPLFSSTHRHPAALAVGFGQAFAVKETLHHPEATLDRDAFWQQLIEVVTWAEHRLGAGDHRVSERLRLLTNNLRDFPLDLQDLCNGTGSAADESWPFAVAMFVRNPGLIEATLLSSINVGGDANTVGAMVGALLGALHGWAAFPEDWKEGLEQREMLEAKTRAFVEALL